MGNNITNRLRRIIELQHDIMRMKIFENMWLTLFIIFFIIIQMIDAYVAKMWFFFGVDILIFFVWLFQLYRKIKEWKTFKGGILFGYFN